MRTFLSLIKVSLNVNFGLSALKYRFTREKKRRWEPILIGAAATFGIGTIVAMLAVFMFGIYFAGNMLEPKQPEMVLTLSFVTASLIVSFFGIFYIMSAFYFSKDMDILVPLPLKPWEVIGSKFVVVMVNEYLTVLPILLPAIVIYGIGEGVGLSYWLKGLALMLVSPVIPLAVGGLFVVILMRFVNLRSSKDLLAIIGGLFGIVAGLVINYFAQQIPKGSEGEFFEKWAFSQAGRIGEIGSKFPPAIWATYGLTKPGIEGAGYFLLFIGFCILLFVLMLWLGNLVFYKSLLAGQEVRRKRRVMTGAEMEKSYGKSSNPVLALFSREWKLFLRTPVFVMNGLAGMIMIPIFVLMPLVSKNKEFDMFLEIVNNPEYFTYVCLGIFGVMLFTASMNIVSCTALSREGKAFWISKMIPVAPGKQAMAKFLHGTSVALIGVAVTAIAGEILLRIPIFAMVGLAVISAMGAALSSAVNLIVDLLNPRLDWTNPQEAVKSNINAFFAILITFAVVALFGGAVAGMLVLELPGWAIFTLLAVLIIVLGIPSIIGVYALAEKRYRSIEM